MRSLLDQRPVRYGVTTRPHQYDGKMFLLFPVLIGHVSR
jgi:hypothetical protein